MVGGGVRPVDGQVVIDLAAIDEDALARRVRAQQQSAQMEQEDGVDEGQPHGAHDGGGRAGGVRGVAGEGQARLAVDDELEEEVAQPAADVRLVFQQGIPQLGVELGGEVGPLEKAHEGAPGVPGQRTRVSVPQRAGIGASGVIQSVLSRCGMGAHASPDFSVRLVNKNRGMRAERSAPPAVLQVTVSSPGTSWPRRRARSSRPTTLASP